MSVASDTHLKCHQCNDVHRQQVGPHPGGARRHIAQSQQIQICVDSIGEVAQPQHVKAAVGLTAQAEPGGIAGTSRCIEHGSIVHGSIGRSCQRVKLCTVGPAALVTFQVPSLCHQQQRPTVYSSKSMPTLPIERRPGHDVTCALSALTTKPMRAVLGRPCARKPHRKVDRNNQDTTPDCDEERQLHTCSRMMCRVHDAASEPLPYSSCTAIWKTMHSGQACFDLITGPTGCCKQRCMVIGSCATSIGAGHAHACRPAGRVLRTQAQQPEKDGHVQPTLLYDISFRVHPHSLGPRQQPLWQGGGQPGRPLVWVRVGASVPA
jgi:hypothetical protein